MVKVLTDAEKLALYEAEQKAKAEKKVRNAAKKKASDAEKLRLASLTSTEKKKLLDEALGVIRENTDKWYNEENVSMMLALKGFVDRWGVGPNQAKKDLDIAQKDLRAIELMITRSGESPLRTEEKTRLEALIKELQAKV